MLIEFELSGEYFEYQVQQRCKDFQKFFSLQHPAQKYLMLYYRLDCLLFVKIGLFQMVDFTNDFYQYSVVGRANVAETILLANDLVQTPKIEEARNEAEELRFTKKISQHKKIQAFINTK